MLEYITPSLTHSLIYYMDLLLGVWLHDIM